MLKKFREFLEEDFDYYSIHESSIIKIQLNLIKVIDRYKILEKILLDKFISKNFILKTYISTGDTKIQLEQTKIFLQDQLFYFEQHKIQFEINRCDFYQFDIIFVICDEFEQQIFFGSQKYINKQVQIQNQQTQVYLQPKNLIVEKDNLPILYFELFYIDFNEKQIVLNDQYKIYRNFGNIDLQNIYDNKQNSYEDFDENSEIYLLNNKFNKIFQQNSFQDNQKQVEENYDLNCYDQDPVYEYYIRGQMDCEQQNLKPDQKIIKKLDKILMSYKINQLKPSHKKLIWDFRNYLSQKKDALILFLYSVDWANKEISEQAIEILKQWNIPNPIDCLFLLSRQFSMNNFYQSSFQFYSLNKNDTIESIRNLGIEFMKKCDQKQVQQLVLQLVASLKYEQIDINDIHNNKVLLYLVTLCENNLKLSSQIYWYINIEYESSNENLKNWYKNIKKTFLELKNQDQITLKYIQNQEKLRQLFQKIKYDSNPQKLNNSLIKEIAEVFQNCHFFFFEENKSIKNFCYKKTKIFSSNTKPLLLTFEDQNKDQVKIIYKYGDDMRPDQLILQCFTLMSQMLSQLNVNAQMTIYKIQVYSIEDGIIEFVRDSQTLQNALSSNKKSMLEYLKKLTQKMKKKTEIKEFINIKKKYKISKIIFENYLNSLASYNVITYILGIGDRHLDNLLITDLGEIFHIDFGFVFGEDPKPYPPPFKFKKQMMEVFYEGYEEQFEQRCVSYFLYLRKNAKLLLNLVFLMVDSNIVINPKRNRIFDIDKVYFMQQRFCLDKSEEEAEIYFKNLIQQALKAVWGEICDQIHNLERWFKF